MIKKIFILFCFISVIVVSLYAQPEIRNLSLYDAKSDVYYFIERQYKARMAFGELEKGDLLETNYYRFDKSGNLVFFETEGKDKEGKSKKENKQYTYNAQKQLIQVLNSDLSKIVFTYNNGKLTQFDRYDKSGKLLERTKRKYRKRSNILIKMDCSSLKKLLQAIRHIHITHSANKPWYNIQVKNLMQGIL